MVPPRISSDASVDMIANVATAASSDSSSVSLLDQVDACAAPAELRVEQVTEEMLAAMCLAWNRVAGDVPFCQWEWLEAWWRHFRQAGDELFVLAVRDAAGQLVGLAPWYIGRSPLVGRIVRFLGSGLVCSDYLSLLCLPGRHEEVATRLADWLNREGAGQWHAIELSGPVTGDPAIECLVQSLRQQGNLVDRRDGLSCWRLQLPADWGVYVAGLSKTRRERVRQLGRRQFDTRRAVLHAVRSEAELARGMAILKDLHQRRRTAVNGSGCFDHQPYTAFLDEVAERFLRLGKLRLQWIELEGRPVACEFDLTGGHGCVLLPVRHRPRRGGRAPGLVRDHRRAALGHCRRVSVLRFPARRRGLQIALAGGSLPTAGAADRFAASRTATPRVAREASR